MFSYCLKQNVPWASTYSQKTRQAITSTYFEHFFSVPYSHLAKIPKCVSKLHTTQYFGAKRLTTVSSFVLNIVMPAQVPAWAPMEQIQLLRFSLFHMFTQWVGGEGISWMSNVPGWVRLFVRACVHNHTSFSISKERRHAIMKREPWQDVEQQLSLLTSKFVFRNCVSRTGVQPQSLP